ncbi:MAG: GTP diphosphokinase [Gammaproteobacteria bacterium]|nr:GTP diphosphokinase [Gammaproteobacteria bacterium]MDH3412515.1 GTP diphosphokinase [Gammaproteobacteria bacterium]
MSTLEAATALHKQAPVQVAPALSRILQDRPGTEAEVIQRAFALAESAHRGQKRASGEPYIGHPVAVAAILHELKLDHETITAALLHDVVEDTDIGLERIREDFGPSVARLVDGVTKMDAIDEYTETALGTPDERRQVDRLKKLLLAIANDVRVVLIKLADRLHNMRTLHHLPEASRRRIARETLDIYAPLASRLGIGQFKWEMEDLSFREIEPQSYTTLDRRLHERRIDTERYVQRVVAALNRKLTENDIRAEVSGRAKHLYGIWRKMKEKNLSFDQVFDIRAVRILVNDVADCYSALGIVHTLWNHVPKEFDDYIANPKSNRYQSLHTAVIGPEGKTLEVQIRTQEMHAHAEYGVAAHWRYKEGAKQARDDVEAKVTWLRQILEVKDESEGPRDFLDRFNAELLNERVYAVTPRGEVLDLPAGATPLDFAYQIHTDVGHRTRGAKVNGVMVPLTYTLKSGDQVEILTTRNATPSRDWLSLHLNYLKTPRARAKVRHWFKQQDYEKNLTAGQDVFQRELRRLGISNPDRSRLLSKFNYKSFEDLLAAIGHGDVSGSQLASALQHALPERVPIPTPGPVRRPKQKRADAGVQIHGVGNLLTQFAKCCRPVPNDAIVGFITRGRGVTIHRSDCPNMLRLDAERRRRLIDVKWTATDTKTYPVDVQINAYDRQGLLRDVTTILAAESVNVVSLDTRTRSEDQSAEIKMTVEVSDLSHLSRVLDRISQLPNVIEARRTA